MTSPNADDTVLIIGVGLIGGSLGRALRVRKCARRVIGWGRSPDRLQQAVDLGILDSFITTWEQIPRETTLVVFCTPVPTIVEQVRLCLPFLPPQAIVTDAGSTKASICTALQDLAAGQPTFIGSHPIAGSEKQGYEYADADLFAGRTCIVTPMASHSSSAVEKVEQFWGQLGMRPVRMSPAEHDRALARTSHVPHLVASGVAASLSPDDLPWTGSGFRDTTRIASGDPSLWTGILLENRDEVRAGLAVVQEKLAAFDASLAANDAKALQELLKTGKELRDLLPVSPAERYTEEELA